MSATDAQARGELWSSLISLLRSYAVTHTVNNAPIRWEADEQEILLRAAGSWMYLNFDAGTGNGRWIMHPDGESRTERPFYLELDGSLRIDSAEAEPMDLAAIEIVGEFAGKAQRAVDFTAVLVTIL
jgi:hypothetical protein